ncbi:MAG: SAP domain-containing protein [Deltaproteobacteria bacterium]|nr:SAP domain-containing protein [Deltaproteobacteria bacterium]
MNWNDTKKKAIAIGVQPGKMKKAELIRAIQTAEGNTPCYGTNRGDCPYTDCCWFEDCAAEYRKTMA